MGAVELDRQGIERRDFPIVRRGYDPASVDVHLRALSAEVEEIQREVEGSGQESLASVAGTQVQGILEAAQATAETIEREAAQDAQRVRAAADADARRTREEAVTRARAHVAAVSQATELLLARVGSMDGETQALVESLRAGAGRLGRDLAAVEAEMGALYDAAAGRGQDAEGAGGGGGDGGTGGEQGTEAGLSPNGPTQTPLVATPTAGAPVETRSEPQEEAGADPRVESPASELPLDEPAPLAQAHGELPPIKDDADGARLVALNMALNGDSREATGRYLAENFQISEPERLLNEVYAAIEG